MRHVRKPDPLPGRIPKKRRQLPLLPLLLTLLVVLVVVNVAVVLTRPDKPQPTAASERPAALATVSAGAGTGVDSVADPSATTKQAPKPRFGLFVGTEPQTVTGFEKWLGRPVQDVLDFANRSTWDTISGTGPLATWRGTKYRLVYAVPMLPDTLGPTREQAMRAGAQGEFDQYFVTLAKNLVKNGQEDAVLRIGWEMNIPSWAWGIKDNKVYVDFFRHIVDAVRSVPGQRFNINWNPNNAFNPYDGVKYWPGNNYVDSVGVDAYDLDGHSYPYPKSCNETCHEQHAQTAWDQVIYGSPRGLAFWTDFAQQHNKQFSLPEWSMWKRYDGTGGGDNPFFLEQMQYFIHAPANKVAFAGYFNLNSPDGQHVLSKYFPIGSKKFRELFGGKEVQAELKERARAAAAGRTLRRTSRNGTATPTPSSTSSLLGGAT